MYEVQKTLKEAITEYVQEAINRFFAKGNLGITYITAIGVVTADYVSGLPQVKFDSDAAASGKGYCWVTPYTPTANDRVLMLKVNHDWVIMGKIVNS